MVGATVVIRGYNALPGNPRYGYKGYKKFELSPLSLHIITGLSVDFIFRLSFNDDWLLQPKVKDSGTHFFFVRSTRECDIKLSTTLKTMSPTIHLRRCC